MTSSRTSHAGVYGWVVLSCLVVVGMSSAGLRAEDAALLTSPKNLTAGGRASFTLTTLDTETQEAIGRDAEVRLLASDGTLVDTFFSDNTEVAGQKHVSFDVPNVAGGSYRLSATVTGITDPLEADVTISRSPAILIETDKPIYKPGQTIQGRVILLDNALQPTDGAVEVVFHDAKGIRIARQNLTANEFGVAAFELDLARELNFGVWKIRVKSDRSESVRDVRVEEYTLPRFELAAELTKSWALVDEPIVGAVVARYFFGRDVEGTVQLRAERWVGTWEEYATVDGTLANGELPFELPPVGFVAGTLGANGLGTVRLLVAVTDATGHEQTSTELVTITEAPLVLTLIPRAPRIVPEQSFEVVIQAKAPDGVPLDTDADVYEQYFSESNALLASASKTVPIRGGTGILLLDPPVGTAYANVEAYAVKDGRQARTETQIGSIYSPGGGFISLTRQDGDGTDAVRVGDEVGFAVVATYSGTVYYEVVAGGRTVLSDATEEPSFSVAITPEMLPAVRVVAYKINPDNEVAADSVAFPVELDLSATIAAAFSAAEVQPGDPVRVTIDAGTGKRTMLGLSIVDESVLALGRSRLHMAGVFEELERRFLEPQAEVHDDGEPPDDGWPPPIHSPGARDILSDAGLVVAYSKNLRVPEGQEFFFWRDFAEDGPVAAVGEGSDSSDPDAVRVRQFFPETWVWQPLLLTDENGLATLNLTAPDSITGWKLAAVGTFSAADLGGAGISFGAAELKVFQEFFVEPSLPYAVTRGETFPVKVDVFNYLDTTQNVNLQLAANAGFEIKESSEINVAVPANSQTAVHFPIQPTGVGEFPLQITARGDGGADAVLRPIRVEPEGRPVEEVTNAVLIPGASETIEVVFPPEAVVGSTRAYLHVTPNPLSQTMQGVSQLLQMPFGCGEQNMIFLAPDIEILKYLREIGELAPEIRATAEYFANVGYQRQLTFQTDDGGFAAFGGEEGSLWLTAFVLSTFAGAREVRDIDETVLAQAAAMLLSRQKEDGSFQTDDFLIHKEMDGGLENIYAMGAYVTNALAEYGGAEVQEGLTRAAQFLVRERTQMAGVNDDPYSLALAAVALLRVPGFGDPGEVVVDRLLELAQVGDDGIHWEPYPVETTGYAAIALLTARDGAGRPEAGAALDWLSTRRNSLGGYGESTQDTVVALRALFLAARRARGGFDVQIQLRDASGVVHFDLHVDQSNMDLFHSVELPEDVGPLTLTSEGEGNVAYQVVRRYNVPGEDLPPPSDLVFNVSYDASHIEVDEIVDVAVEIEYRGEKEATGMVIADVGVPTGFAVVGASVDALVEAAVVSRVEIAGRKVIFYIDSLPRNEPLMFEFQIRALYPVEAEGPISRAYEYYDPNVEAFHRQAGVSVRGDVTEGELLRGDFNDDGTVNVADPIALLNYLFGGVVPAVPRLCEDAGDANDDGRLDVSDPVYVLIYLFAGGAPPPPPFPERGMDLTTDGLEC